MKEEWLMPDAVVPVDADTTAALVAEIKRLIGVVGDLALQQALAQPEQEPVAWVECAVIPWLQSKDTNVYAMTKLHRIPNEHYDTPLYTTPSNREWVGLAKDEIHEMIMGMRTKNMGVIMTEEIFRDVEAKLKEKNT